MLCRIMVFLKMKIEPYDIVKSCKDFYAFAEAFIDQSTENEKTAPMSRVHMRYSDFVSDVRKKSGNRHEVGKIWIA